MGGLYPKISLITVVRNDPQGLRTTLVNITQAKYPNKEIIVIDGDSTDNTMQVAREFSDQIAVLKSEPDQGIYDAMNKGIAVATGQYVWFVNARDTILNTEELYELFTTDHFLADIYYGETIICSQEGTDLGLRRKKMPKKLTTASLKNGMVVCHQSFLMRRSLCPTYDLKYRFSADYKWMIECTKVAKSAVNTGVALSRFTLGGATTQNHKKSLRERYTIMRSEFGLCTTLLRHIKFCFDAILGRKYR